MKSLKQVPLLPLCLTLVLIFMGAITIVLANSDAAYELFWWTADGGSDSSAGGEYGLSGTTGQYDAGDLSSSHFDLDGGFWTEDGEELTVIPLIFSNYCGGFPGPREQEENDAAGLANGPLCYGRNYIGNPDDDLPNREDDYFYINWKGGPFRVTVTNFLTNLAQVIVYYENVKDPDPPYAWDRESGIYVVDVDGIAGRYLIRVVAMSTHEVGHGDYTLRVTAP